MNLIGFAVCLGRSIDDIDHLVEYFLYDGIPQTSFGQLLQMIQQLLLATFLGSFEVRMIVSSPCAGFVISVSFFQVRQDFADSFMAK